jgi:hypothetical protein
LKWIAHVDSHPAALSLALQERSRRNLCGVASYEESLRVSRATPAVRFVVA